MTDHNNLPEESGDAFSEMEQMLKEAQEKLAKFQQEHTKEPEDSAEGEPKAAEEEAEDPFKKLCEEFPEDQFPLGTNRESGEPLGLSMGSWHRLGIWVGQKNLTRKILGNLMIAAKHTGMQVMVLRRKLFSEFANAELFQHAGLEPGDAYFWNGDASGMEILARVLHREISNQNVYRDEFCRENGIPEDAPGRAEKASAFIRRHTRPLLVLLESVSDLTAAGASEDVTEGLRLYLTASGGYNIYFAGMFSPEDREGTWEHPLGHAFTEAEHALLIGGNHEGQQLIHMPEPGMEEGPEDGFILRSGKECIAGTLSFSSLLSDLDEFSMALQELMQATEEYTEPADGSAEKTEE